MPRTKGSKEHIGASLRVLNLKVVKNNECKEA